MWQVLCLAFYICINSFYPNIGTGIGQKLRLETSGNLPEVTHLLEILFWIQKSTMWSLAQAAQSSGREGQRTKQRIIVLQDKHKDEGSLECCQNMGALNPVGRGEGGQGSFLVKMSLKTQLSFSSTPYWTSMATPEGSRAQAPEQSLFWSPSSASLRQTI